ncbi:MAG: hypothetical protein MZV49_25720 [Rhodopseudomonas palustris]|nr:hypothetical protein [Rhodopseudomonas palustris]
MQVRMADRYAYVPFIGLLDHAGLGSNGFLPICDAVRKSGCAILDMLILTAGVVSRHQIEVWENSRNPLSHAPEGYSEK